MSITTSGFIIRARRSIAALWLCVMLAGLCLAGQHAVGLAQAAGAQGRPAEVGEAERLYEQVIELYGRGRFVEAIPLAERAFSIYEKAFGPEHPDVATLLNDLGVLYRETGQLARAEPLLTRCLALREKLFGAEHPEVAVPLSNLAELHKYRGDYDRAEALHVRSLGLREKGLGPEHPSVAVTLNNLAELYREKGQLARAEPLYERALAINEKALGPEHPEVATALNNLAVMHRDGGEYARAEPLFTRSLSIFEKVLGAEHPSVATLLNNLAELYKQKGEFARAEPVYRRSLTVLEKAFGPDHPRVAAALNNLAGLYIKLGDFPRAEPLHARALSINEKALGPAHADVATGLNNLAWLYETTGDSARAEALYVRSLSVREKALGPEHPSVAVTLNNLASLYRKRGDLARAEPLYVRSLSVREKSLGPDHPDVALTLSGLALLYKTKGDYARAESLYQRALALSERAFGPEHHLVASVLSNLSLLYVAKGDAGRAIQFRSRAQDVRERNLSLVLAAGSERRKLAYLATLAGETDATVSLHAHSAPSDPRALRLALTTILRLKGRALDAMSDQVASLRRRLDPQDRALLDRLSAAQSQLSALILGAPRRTPGAESATAAARLEEEIERLQDAVSRRSAEFLVQTQPVALEKVQAALPAGAALVEFFLYRPFDAKATTAAARRGASRYVAYVLLGDGEPRWADLGEAEAVDAAAWRLRAALKDPTRKDVKAAARSLDERLMRPVRPLLGGARHVFVAPDGALNLIPFAALVDENDRYLVETYSLTYLTAGRDLLRRQVEPESDSRPLVLADPLFGAARPGDGAARSEGGDRRSADMAQMYFGHLPGTAEEARALGVALPGATVLTQVRATEAALKQVSRPSLLHVATHGFFLPDQPLVPASAAGDLADADVDAPAVSARVENPLLRSGLALEGANQRQGSGGEDGILTALEAAGLDLWGTKLVVLSACETGVGQVRNGEGVYGLRRALVLAGSESQVMSLWQVSDEAARDLMIAYYRRLAAGEGRTEALREVQLGMLMGRGRETAAGQRGLLDNKRGAVRTDFSHPFYWAAFIQSGDWRPVAGRALSVKGR